MIEFMEAVLPYADFPILVGLLVWNLNTMRGMIAKQEKLMEKCLDKLE